MRGVLLSAAAAAAPLAAAAAPDAGFSAWRARFGKRYATPAALARARAHFDRSAAEIAAHNAKGLSWAMGHTQFSDLSASEFDRRVGVTLRARPRTVVTAAPSLRAAVGSAPAAVDWAAAGKVTTVKDQKVCGACWAFASVSAVESAYAIASGQLLNLSVQDVISCQANGSPYNPDGNRYGFCCACNGGDPKGAIGLIRDHGAVLEEDMPYTSSNCSGEDLSPANCNCDQPPYHGAKCPAAPRCPAACPARRDAAVTVANITALPAADENGTLLRAVARAPVIAEVDCEAAAFKNYKSGVIDDPNCAKIHNHVVLIVGYGTDEATGKDYWRIKNSFGPLWGEHGYVRIVRGKGMCGIGGEQYTVDGAAKYHPPPVL